MTSRYATIAALVLWAGLNLPVRATAAPTDPPKKRAPPAAAAPKPTAKKPATDKAESKTEAAPKATPAQRAEVARVKSVYIFAASSCTPGARCDPALVKDAEQQFMRACEKCTTTERCEIERDLIVKGEAKRRASPCD